MVERLVANEKVEGSNPFARSIFQKSGTKIVRTCYNQFMSELYKKKCVSCDGNTSPFDTSEIHKYLKKIDGWEVKNDSSKNYYLIKQFNFENFIDSQNFINAASKIAETEGHHPDISFGWGYAKIKIFTHAIKGLAESDFILASKIDQI